MMNTTTTTTDPAGAYITPEDVVIESLPSWAMVGAVCDWCDDPAVASVDVWSAGRNVATGDRACASHLALYFGPTAGRIVTDHRAILAGESFTGLCADHAADPCPTCDGAL